MYGEVEDICERLSLTKLEQEVIQIDSGQLYVVLSKGANCQLVKLHSPNLLTKKPSKPQ